MARVTYSAIKSNQDDAGFRAWAKDLSDALKAAGLTQTTDTGQVNLTTATRPAAGQYAGYEIYRFNDAHQASAPVFIKIEYGQGGTNTSMGLRVSVGTGTNGAGTLLNTHTPLTITTGSTDISQAFPTWVCYDGGSLTVFFINGTTSSHSIAFSVCRTTNNAGYTNEGVYVLGHVSATGYSSYTISYTGLIAIVSPINGVGCLLPFANQPTSSDGTNIALYRNFVMTPRLRPVAGVLTYLNGEIAQLSEITVNVAGKNRRYICLGNWGLGGAQGTNYNYAALAFLWD